MADSIKKSVEGTIVSGTKAGYRIRIDDDLENTGGFLIIFWKPDAPHVGADYWVELYSDIMPFFVESGWKVEWEQPVESLQRKEWNE